MTKTHSEEIKHGERFQFGHNWARFLELIDEEKILQAENSLKRMLQVTDLVGKKFLDAGSGSGLFSLAARRLGARVYSFDYDPRSVACTRELRRRYISDRDPEWAIEEASVLDEKFLSGLGQFDVVYSWGVLHHTGAMWDALGNVVPLVLSEGTLFIAIYNDQAWVTKYWIVVKKLFNKKKILKLPIQLFHAPYLIGAPWVIRAMTGRFILNRGMSFWYDMIDWLGGYPFEVATPERIFRFYRDKGFTLKEMKTCGARHGCNEFVFTKERQVATQPLP